MGQGSSYSHVLYEQCQVQEMKPHKNFSIHISNCVICNEKSINNQYIFKISKIRLLMRLNVLFLLDEAVLKRICYNSQHEILKERIFYVILSGISDLWKWAA